MAITFNEASVPSEDLRVGVRCRRLLTTARVPGTKVLLDRLEMDPRAELDIAVGRGALAWLQVLEGEALLASGAQRLELADTHVAFLPPQTRGTLSAPHGAVVLYAQVPDAAAFDAALTAGTTELRLVDWTREPVLDSQHDARKRIYLVTPKLFGTTALKGEMIIYPPGTEGAKHHHEGAEHFMYVLKGAATAYADERPIPVRKGDLIYYSDRETHYLRCAGEEMRFVEFFVPGVYKTIWAEGAPVCTWLPTGRDIRGRSPAREIAGHSSAAATPQDV